VNASTVHITPEDIRNHPEMWERIWDAHDPRLHSAHDHCVVIFAHPGQIEEAEMVDPGWFSSHLNDLFSRVEYYLLINPGFPVVLPNRSNVYDSDSATGKLMSPVPDLSPVAAAGSETFERYRKLMLASEAAAAAGPVAALAAAAIAEAYLLERLNANVGQGGTFDYQRTGNRLSGFTQLRQFRDVSNFNVGLFCQKAGLTLDETLSKAGTFAKYRSSNSDSNQPYGLNPRTAKFIRVGHDRATLYR
jgi:hypothetical protein